MGSVMLDRLEEIAERLELGQRGRVVDAVDQRRLLRLERLGRGDVRLDHELLDQAVGLEPLGHDDAVDRAVRLEEHLPLGQVELERLALLAAAAERLVAAPQRRRAHP